MLSIFRANMQSTDLLFKLKVDCCDQTSLVPYWTENRSILAFEKTAFLQFLF